MDISLALCADRDIGDLAADRLFEVLNVSLSLLGQILHLRQR